MSKPGTPNIGLKPGTPGSVGQGVGTATPGSRLATPPASLHLPPDPWSSSVFSCHQDPGSCKSTSNLTQYPVHDIKVKRLTLCYIHEDLLGIQGERQLRWFSSPADFVEWCEFTVGCNHHESWKRTAAHYRPCEGLSEKENIEPMYLDKCKSNRAFTGLDSCREAKSSASLWQRVPYVWQ